jgi:hypothetical protein
VGVLLVEQNVRYALETATRGYVLQTGRIILSGDCAKAARSVSGARGGADCVEKKWRHGDKPLTLDTERPINPGIV